MKRVDEGGWRRIEKMVLDWMLNGFQYPIPSPTLHYHTASTKPQNIDSAVVYQGFDVEGCCTVFVYSMCKKIATLKNKIFNVTVLLLGVQY